MTIRAATTIRITIATKPMADLSALDVHYEGGTEIHSTICAVP